MAKHILNDLSLEDGLEYHKITGQSLTEFGRVARYRTLNAVAEIIINTSLSDVYEIITNGYEREEGNDDIADIVEQFFNDAFSVQPEAYDPDAVDKEAIRWRAYEMVKKAQLGIEAEDYYKCVACIVWLWTGKKQGKTFEDYLASTSYEEQETKFMELMLEAEGVVLPKAEGDSPLETDSTET